VALRGFVAQSWTFLPAACWGAAAAITLTRCRQFVTVHRSALWCAGAAAALTGIAYLAWRGLNGPGPTIARNLAGVGCLTVVLAAPAPQGGRLWTTLGRASFGIYLAHWLFIGVFHTAVAAVGLGRPAWVDPLTVLAAVAASYGLTRLLQSRRATAWLAP
jgi:peptidoglycan/LPS O-acetylase OafA/YrhL